MKRRSRKDRTDRSERIGGGFQAIKQGANRQLEPDALGERCDRHQGDPKQDGQLIQRECGEPRYRVEHVRISDVRVAMYKYSLPQSQRMSTLSCVYLVPTAS